MMQKKTIRFSTAITHYYFDASFAGLKELADKKRTIVLTDEHVFAAHQKKLSRWNCIVIPAGESSKNQKTVDFVIQTLIEKGADRSTMLVGAGGGTISDLAGYIASIYLRGIAFGFVPTSLLAMVDASIGGKNGINVGLYKNMVGTLNHPQFILFDRRFLDTLPQSEWQNGFAEIIKHAAIANVTMFRELEQHDVSFYQKKTKETSALIRTNALLKTKVVVKDERETNLRRILNFGHTLGHALENLYDLSHGQAISIGMAYASQLSASLMGFRDHDRLISLIEQYGLPVRMSFDKKRVLNILSKDKKREQDKIRFILLERLGKAVVELLPIQKIADTIE